MTFYSISATQPTYPIFMGVSPVSQFKLRFQQMLKALRPPSFVGVCFYRFLKEQKKK